MVSKARETVMLSICYKAVAVFPERNEKSISDRRMALFKTKVRFVANCMEDTDPPKGQT